MAIEIQEALLRFNPAEFHEHLEAAERERTEVLRRFPLERWHELSLKDYALGQDQPVEQAFSWWLEYGAQNLGSIRGGSAKKHNIYRRKKEGNWYYRPEFTNEYEAWDNLRQAFVTMFEYARTERWLEIDNIDGMYGTRSVRVKTLHIYFPEKMLPITSYDHLRYYLAKLNVPRTEYRHLEVVSLNRMLLEKLRQHQEMHNWTTNEIERFLYWWDDPREEIRGPQLVKIAPGEEGRLWQDCFENGYIRIGWDKVTDLREYTDEAEFRADFEQAYLDEYKGNRSTLRRKADEVWTLMGLEPGDKIIANRGVTAILGIGTVIEPGYEWLQNIESFHHAVHVAWDTTHAGEKALPDQWRFVTVAPVSQELYQRLIGASNEVESTISSSPLFGQIADALERKGQVILHGPPGTGKTYQALRFAQWWLAQEKGQKTKQTADSQLTLVTFHPSYSYEDFIEGFRPQDSGEGLRLKLSDGLFKTVCSYARVRPDRKYLIIVDEINRANLAKVFGEIITLLERDKRGVSVTLPQSKELFDIPPNVFMLGTMNTSDRSIRLMDAALRRRFGFIEIMPDMGLLRGAQIDGGEGRLDLYNFLTALNVRISRTQGREKQIGHSFFIMDGQPISDAAEFGNCFRQDILPLLQEYCYDDYGQLAEYLGKGLVDVENATLLTDVLINDDRLIAALVEFTSEASGLA